MSSTTLSSRFSVRGAFGPYSGIGRGMIVLKTNLAAGDETLEMAVRVERIAEVLQRVPVSNLPLLKYLIQFLRRVEMNSSVNKMTVSYVLAAPQPCILLFPASDGTSLTGTLQLFLGPTLFDRRWRQCRTRWRCLYCMGLYKFSSSSSIWCWKRAARSCRNLAARALRLQGGRSR